MNVFGVRPLFVVIVTDSRIPFQSPPDIKTRRVARLWDRRVDSMSTRRLVEHLSFQLVIRPLEKEREHISSEVDSLSNQQGIGKKKQTTHLAVAQKTGIPKWLALVSGNLDQNLRFAFPG